jgi:hypothetical protein
MSVFTSKSQARRIAAADEDFRLLAERHEDLREQYLEARGEIIALKQALNGHPDWTASWLMAKVERQRRALDRLTLTVTGQRLALRALNKLGRGLTRQEYVEERATWHQGMPLSERLEAYFPFLEKQ